MLLEGPAATPGWLQGLSEHYVQVIFPGPLTWRNRRFIVRFRDIKEEVLAKEAVEEP